MQGDPTLRDEVLKCWGFDGEELHWRLFTETGGLDSRLYRVIWKHTLGVLGGWDALWQD
jgi:hypothetical protein